jgi:ABC-type glycerol-3-phosphate transport system permease component
MRTPPQNTTAARQARTDLAGRRALRTARVLMIYGLLLGGAWIFSLPFIWMIGTSFKVDREMFSERITLLPMRPVPAAASPYLDDRYFAEPEGPAYDRIRDEIVAALRTYGNPLPDTVHGRDEWVDRITPGIYQRLVQTLPRGVWEAPDAQLFDAVRAGITPAMIEEVLQRVWRRFTLGAVRVRSLDLQEQDLTDGVSLASLWEVEGPARLVDRAPHADLVYDFEQSEEDEIRLHATVQLPFAAERLYRTSLFIQPDDSWHSVQFYVEKNGALYKGMRPEYLGDFQWGAVTLKEYGPEDESTKIRTWLPYTRVDAGPQYEARPDHVRLTMVVTRASQRDAWWAKVQRNYRDALDHIPFWRYTATSAFLVIMNIVGNILSCSLVAYAFARLQWPGRNLSFGVMLATLMIPPQVTMIPHFLIIRSLGWYNTLYPLWVISFFGNAFNIFLLRQFMKGIPRDLEDAAKIDGCNFLQVYWYVIMPLIKPTLACISIFTFMTVWNDFMGPLIYLSDQRLYPLSLGLYAFNVQAGGNLGMMMAGSLMMTLPVIIIFFFAQKYFIQGVTLTGMKG